MDGGDAVGLRLLPVRVGVERAELCGEGGVLVPIEMLAAEEHHFVVEDGHLDAVPDSVAEGTAQVTPLISAPIVGSRG